MDRIPHILCICMGLYIFLIESDIKRMQKRMSRFLYILFALFFCIGLPEKDTKRDAKRDAYFSHTFLCFSVQAVRKNTEGIKRGMRKQ